MFFSNCPDLLSMGVFALYMKQAGLCRHLFRVATFNRYLIDKKYCHIDIFELLIWNTGARDKHVWMFI